MNVDGLVESGSSMWKTNKEQRELREEDRALLNAYWGVGEGVVGRGNRVGRN